MKVLLRDTRTGLFYARAGEWTREQEEATDFEGPDVALDTVRQTSLEAVEVVVQFEDTSFEIPLTIVSAGE